MICDLGTLFVYSRNYLFFFYSFKKITNKLYFNTSDSFRSTFISSFTYSSSESERGSPQRIYSLSKKIFKLLLIICSHSIKKNYRYCHLVSVMIDLLICLLNIWVQYYLIVQNFDQSILVKHKCLHLNIL